MLTSAHTPRCFFAHLGKHPSWDKYYITTHHLTCTAHTSIKSQSLIRLFVIVSDSFNKWILWLYINYSRLWSVVVFWLYSIFSGFALLDRVVIKPNWYMQQPWWEPMMPNLLCRSPVAPHLMSQNSTFPACLTLGLPLFMKHHQVQGIVEVLCHLCNIMSCQSIGAVNRFFLQVCPIYTILDRIRVRGKKSFQL